MKEYIDTGKKDTRSGFGAGLLEAGRRDSRVVALAADLKGSLKMNAFAAEFPERFVECGIAEANMVGVAAGLALTGKIPFCGSFAEFITGRVYDQIRQEVAYGRTNVKLASSHAGITLGEDGATHQTMEDIALMRALPGMTVLVPCDYNQTVQATLAAAAFEGPVYLRFGRPSVPNFTDPSEPFEIGKTYVLNEGTDVTLVACGHTYRHQEHLLGQNHRMYLALRQVNTTRHQDRERTDERAVDDIPPYPSSLQRSSLQASQGTAQKYCR